MEIVSLLIVVWKQLKNSDFCQIPFSFFIACCSALANSLDSELSTKYLFANPFLTISKLRYFGA